MGFQGACPSYCHSLLPKNSSPLTTFEQKEGGVCSFYCRKEGERKRARGVSLYHDVMLSEYLVSGKNCHQGGQKKNKKSIHAFFPFVLPNRNQCCIINTSMGHAVQK